MSRLLRFFLPRCNIKTHRRLFLLQLRLWSRSGWENRCCIGEDEKGCNAHQWSVGKRVAAWNQRTYQISAQKVRSSAFRRFVSIPAQNRLKSEVHALICVYLRLPASEKSLIPTDFVDNCILRIFSKLLVPRHRSPTAIKLRGKALQSPVRDGLFIALSEKKT